MKPDLTDGALKHAGERVDLLYALLDRGDSPSVGIMLDIAGYARALVYEVRRRRAAALTIAERGDIARFMPLLECHPNRGHDHELETTIAVLRRLIAAERGSE